MKKLIVFLVIYSSLDVYGQIEYDNYQIGNFIDINKNVINGYYDFDYEPDKSLNVAYSIGKDFTTGYYYDLDGVKHVGVLKYTQNNTFFKFKSGEEEKEKTIKPDECIGYVIGVDSFAVIENFDVQRDMGAFHTDKREYAEVVESFNGYTFYKYTKAGTQNILINYLVRLDSSSSLISFPKNSIRFKPLAAEIFGSFIALKENIENGTYDDDDDIPVLIKLLKYNYYFETHRKIYFNSSWDETDDPNKAKYYATIDRIVDLKFHVKYNFINGTKIYEGYFSSFYPHKKEGEFLLFYPNGNVRKKITYANNKPESISEYYSNSNIHRQYIVKDEKLYVDALYTNICESVLNEFGSGREIVFDSARNIEITYEYVNHELSNAYLIDDKNNKIYQVCEKNAKLKAFKSLQGKINLEFKYPIESIKLYNHGFVLIKCIVEPSGITSEIQVIKGVDSFCDNQIANFLSYLKTYNHWKPGKVEGEKVRQEIIIPIDFSIIGFSRYRNNYNFFWMTQHMMMQQQMMKPPPPPPVPTDRF